MGTLVMGDFELYYAMRSAGLALTAVLIPVIRATNPTTDSAWIPVALIYQRMNAADPHDAAGVAALTEEFRCRRRELHGLD